VSASPQLHPMKGPSSIPSTPTNSYASSNAAAMMTMNNQMQYDSSFARDPKINMEEYAYKKIFVGGLHYDTRDGFI
jgi:hypothetical protein